MLANGEEFSQTFDEAGTFAYHCTPHPFMHGTVTVSDEADAMSGTVNVNISQNSFDPAEVKVKPGTTVTWTNQDPYEHTITSDDTAEENGGDDDDDGAEGGDDEKGSPGLGLVAGLGILGLLALSRRI